MPIIISYKTLILLNKIFKTTFKNKVITVFLMQNIKHLNKKFINIQLYYSNYRKNKN